MLVPEATNLAAARAREALVEHLREKRDESRRRRRERVEESRQKRLLMLAAYEALKDFNLLGDLLEIK